MRCTCKAKQTTLCSHVQQAGNENNIPVVYIQQCMDESADVSPSYIHNSSQGTANPSCGEWQRSILGSSHLSQLITRQARVCVIKSYCISSIGAGWIVGRDVQTGRQTTVQMWWQTRFPVSGRQWLKTTLVSMKEYRCTWDTRGRRVIPLLHVTTTTVTSDTGHISARIIVLNFLSEPRPTLTIQAWEQNRFSAAD